MAGSYLPRIIVPISLVTKICPATIQFRPLLVLIVYSFVGPCSLQDSGARNTHVRAAIQDRKRDQSDNIRRRRANDMLLSEYGTADSLNQPRLKSVARFVSLHSPAYRNRVSLDAYASIN